MYATWEERNAFNFAFVLSRDEISKCVSILAKLGPVRIEAACADNIRRTFETLENLLEYENDLKRAIIGLTLASRNHSFDENGVSIELRFNKDRFPGTEVTVRGPEMEVVRLRESIAPILAGTRARFGALGGAARAFLFNLAGFSLIGLSLNSALKEGGYAIDICIGGVVLIVLSVYALPRFFPYGTFAIGQGLKRHENDEKMRFAVCISAPLSLAGRGIWSLFYKS